MRVGEQRTDRDVRKVGDLARGGRFLTLFPEDFARRFTDPSTLFDLAALATPENWQQICISVHAVTREMEAGIDSAPFQST